MKDFTSFIVEKNIKENKNSIFDNIDSSEFKWNAAYSDDDYLKKCKDDVHKFADEIYPDIKQYERIEQLFKDSYRQYLNTNKWSNAKKDEQYEYAMKSIKRNGWSQFESYSLEQGWWVFMSWVKNKK